MSGEHADARARDDRSRDDDGSDALERADLGAEDVPSLAEASPSAGSVGSPPTSGLVEPGTASTEQADDAEAPERADPASDEVPDRGDDAPADHRRTSI